MTAQKILNSYEAVSQRNLSHVTEIGRRMEQVADLMSTGAGSQPNASQFMPQQQQQQQQQGPDAFSVPSPATATNNYSNVTQPPPRMPLAPSKPQSTPSWIRPPKVLLVEDDPICRNLSAKLLQVFGCTYDVANDGQRAVDLTSVGNKYDLILVSLAGSG